MSSSAEAEAGRDSDQSPGNDGDGTAPAPEEPPAEPGRLDAFISYKRLPEQTDFVDRLAADLSDRGKTVWVDRHSIEAAAQWRARIERGIGLAKAFIFVLSRDSATSVDCRKELEIAVEAHKRIVPVLFEDLGDVEQPVELGDTNWIDFRREDDHDAAVAKVLDALDSDLEWRDAHTRLGLRAAEWAGSARDASFLLRGSELGAAEAWSADADNHEERPTTTQLEFVRASRQGATKRQRRVFGAVSVALAVAIALSVIALIQRGQAVAGRDQAQAELRNAQSVTMAAESNGLAQSNVPLSVLLGIEARERAGTPQAVDALAASLTQPLAGIEPIDSPVISVAFSSNGALLATGDDKGYVDLLNRRTGSLTHLNTALPLVSGVDAVDGVTFSPDGSTLLWGDQGGSVSLEDLRTRSVSTPLDDDGLVSSSDGSASAVAFSPDGSMIAAGFSGGQVVVYDLTTKTGTVLDDGSSVGGVAFSPDGSTLASGDSMGQVVLYDLASKTTTILNDGSSVDGVAFSPDGSTLASGDNGGQVVLYDLASKTTSTLNDGSPVNAVGFSDDGSTLASADSGGQVVLYDLASKTTTSLGDGSIALSVAFSPDGFVASGDAGGQLLFFDQNKNNKVRTTLYGGTQHYPVYTVTFSADGSLVAWGDAAGDVDLYDRTTRTTTTLHDNSQILSIAFSRDGSMLAWGDYGGDAILYDRRTGTMTTLDASFPVHGVAFSPDGSQIVFGDAGGTVVRYDVRTKALHTIFDGNQLNPVFTVAMSRNGSVAWGDGAGRVELYDPRTQKTTTLAREPRPINSVSFDRTGNILASGDAAGRVVLFDLKTGTTTTLDEGSPVNGVAISANGSTVVGGDNDEHVVLVNRARRTRTTLDLGSPVNGVAISPDGSTVAAAGTSGEVVLFNSDIWSAPLAAVKRQLCAELGGTSMTANQWSAYASGLPYHRTAPEIRGVAPARPPRTRVTAGS